MSEKDLNLEENLDVSDLSSISLDDDSLGDIDDILDSETTSESTDTTSDSSDGNSLNVGNLNFETPTTESSIDEKVFLESWELLDGKKNVLKDWDNFWSYLRRFFFSALLTLFWILAIALFYSFSVYLEQATKPNPDESYQSYVVKYKEKYKKVKEFLWFNVSYQTPIVWASNETLSVNEILNAEDIDYIEKKDMLSSYVSDLVRNAQDRADYAEQLKQDIAKQWFLPEELELLLSEDQAIDTIQRSLNALEVIKFSTAVKVFSYMNTALATISEMIRWSWASPENLYNLFVQLWSRWEKDISAYVYMCYLNPFEINVDCGTIWDLDTYYTMIKDNSLDIKLLKNSMSAISQLLEKEDTTLFSITFNWFNAEDENIQFNVEVYTSQEDEKSLMEQWKKNPNIFILTNIINLLKQSSFIIWADINTKEVNVDQRSINQWWLTRTVNYSTMDFTVPIQKDTEREIFDYVDIDSLKKLLSERWFDQYIEEEEENAQETDIIEENVESEDEVLENVESSDVLDDSWLDLTGSEELTGTVDTESNLM